MAFVAWALDLDSRVMCMASWLHGVAGEGLVTTTCGQQALPHYPLPGPLLLPPACFRHNQPLLSGPPPHWPLAHTADLALVKHPHLHSPLGPKVFISHPLANGDVGWEALVSDRQLEVGTALRGQLLFWDVHYLVCGTARVLVEEAWCGGLFGEGLLKDSLFILALPSHPGTASTLAASSTLHVTRLSYHTPGLWVLLR